MRSRYKSAAVLSAVVLLGCGALLLNQSVSAAGEGKISGMVKLDGTAPHMRGIDMSKDPVSYTHLDVYKRQLRIRPARSTSKACLPGSITCGAVRGLTSSSVSSSWTTCLSLIHI